MTFATWGVAGVSPAAIATGSGVGVVVSNPALATIVAHAPSAYSQASPGTSTWVADGSSCRARAPGAFLSAIRVALKVPNIAGRPLTVVRLPVNADGVNS